MRFRCFVILDVDVDPASAAKGAPLEAVAAEIVREAIAQQGYAVEIHALDANGNPHAGLPFVSGPHRGQTLSSRVSDRVALRLFERAGASGETSE